MSPRERDVGPCHQPHHRQPRGDILLQLYRADLIERVVGGVPLHHKQFPRERKFSAGRLGLTAI